MSAKLPRRSFAAPLVVTLAMPACLVTSSKPAPAPVTSNTGNEGETSAHMNPPRTQPTEPAQPTQHPGHGAPPQPRDPQPGNQVAQQTQQAPTEATLRTWTVYVQASGKGQECYASHDITCPPKGATCNPPPPTKLASCPSGITAERPLKIREDAANSCSLYYPMPACPANVACNPPRPQTVSCPTH